MKPLAFAADAGELIFIYGFSMAVSLFDRLRSARSQIVEKCRYSTAKPIIAQSTNLVAEKIAVPRTRGSVRRASGFVQIPITLIEKGQRLFSQGLPSAGSRTRLVFPSGKRKFFLFRERARFARCPPSNDLRALATAVLHSLLA